MKKLLISLLVITTILSTYANVDDQIKAEIQINYKETT